MPLLRARIDFETVPRHIEACLKATLESLDPCQMPDVVAEKLRTPDLFLKELMTPIRNEWNPSSGGRWSVGKMPVRLDRIPQAVQNFRLGVIRQQIPVSEGMEVALTETLWSAMNVIQADNDILVKIAETFDNNLNYRHEVGRLVVIRDVALSGEFPVS